MSLRNRLARWLYRSITDDCLHVGGRNFRLPTLFEARAGQSEPWMRELINAVAPADGPDAGVFLDVGVNLGQTLMALRSVRPTMEYLGVEPNPQCVHYVEALIKANTIDDAQVVPIALSDETKLLLLQFYIRNDTDSSASIVPDYRPDRPVVRSKLVPAHTATALDAAVDLSRAAVIKIDVEGAEAEIFETIADLMSTSLPKILFEVLPAYHPDNVDRIARQDRIMAVLRETGYRLFRVRKSEYETLEGLSPIEGFGVYDTVADADHVALPPGSAAPTIQK